jgi:hypothetical protein
LPDDAILMHDEFGFKQAMRRQLLLLTLCCSYCGAPSAWQTPRDGREYCPAHVFIAQLKADGWQAAARRPPPDTERHDVR